METTFERKQLWLERIMSSKLPHARKTFAFCIFKRMYGDKITSHPDTEMIIEDGGFSSGGHFTEYRRELVECGALYAELDYHTSGATNKNYEYTLNLDWDGSPTTSGESRTSSGESHTTSGESHTTTGGSNILNNTLNNPSINLTKDAPACADAPTVTFNKLILEESSFSYRLKPVSSFNVEPAEPVYFVDLTGVTKETAIPPAEVSLTTDRAGREQRDIDEWIDNIFGNKEKENN